MVQGTGSTTKVEPVD